MKDRKVVRSKMDKQVGKETARAILKKVDKMMQKKASASDIEEMVAKELAAYIEKAISPCVMEWAEIVAGDVIGPILIAKGPEIRK